MERMNARTTFLKSKPKFFPSSNTMDSKFAAIFSISFFFFFITQTGAVQLHKTTIKTIYTKYGDIFDCIDINKQPSLDHPLLQNHTIQMKPNLIPKTSSPVNQEKNYANLELEDGGCPDGYVPIKRIQEQDIKRLRAHLKKYPSALNPNAVQNSGWHASGMHTLRMHIPFRAARGVLNIYNPAISNTQHSDSLVSLIHGASDALNCIQAGWSVNPPVYGDRHVRLYTLWTADNFKHTGCIDMHCQGFVQISKNIVLGNPITPISQYGGKQTHLAVAISQDQFTGNWWLITSQNAMVGYWPKEIFTGLSSYAEEARWGGQAHNPIVEPAPPMGSGHKPEEGVGKACSIEEMQYVRSEQGKYEDLNADMLMPINEEPHCYGVKLIMDASDIANILFGGPGGRCGW